MLTMTPVPSAGPMAPPLDIQRKAAPSSLMHKLCVMLSPRKRKQLEEAPQLSQQAAAGPGGGSPLQRLSATSAGRGCSFERVFRYFDEDGDGKISPSELRSCMRMVGEELSAEEAEAVVESTDSDGDGLLGLEDFVRLVEAEGEEEKGRSLREAFRVYEMEGQGCITPKSLRRALRRLGDARSTKECADMICRFDLDGDGVLSFDEFRVMMI